MKETSGIALLVGVLIGFALAQVISVAAANAPVTEIVTRGHAVIVIVNGQERARFDDGGLHVNGDVAYSGASIDTVHYPAASNAPAGASP